MRWGIVWLVVGLIPVDSIVAQTLSEKLLPLIREHQGKVAVALKHLPSGETFFHQADEVMPTASLIKFPILIEAYWQVEEGKRKLSDELVLKAEDMVPGSGILTEHFTPGAKFCLRDALRMMIVWSDNTATNMVLDQIGLPSTNERMKQLGLPQTRVNAKVFKGSTTSIDPMRTKQYGLGSTTAREMLALWEGLHQGKWASAKASREMLEHLKKCDDRDKFPRFLPKNVQVAHKTGSVSDARTAAGILYFAEGPVVLCVLTANNADRSWTADNAGDRLCAKIAEIVYTHYHRPSASQQR